MELQEFTPSNIEFEFDEAPSKPETPLERSAKLTDFRLLEDFQEAKRGIEALHTEIHKRDLTCPAGNDCFIRQKEIANDEIAQIKNYMQQQQLQAMQQAQYPQVQPPLPYQTLQSTGNLYRNAGLGQIGVVGNSQLTGNETAITYTQILPQEEVTARYPNWLKGIMPIKK